MVVTASEPSRAANNVHEEDDDNDTNAIDAREYGDANVTHEEEHNEDEGDTVTFDVLRDDDEDEEDTVTFDVLRNYANAAREYGDANVTNEEEHDEDEEGTVTFDVLRDDDEDEEDTVTFDVLRNYAPESPPSDVTAHDSPTSEASYNSRLPSDDSTEDESSDGTEDNSSDEDDRNEHEEYVNARTEILRELFAIRERLEEELRLQRALVAQMAGHDEDLAPERADSPPNNRDEA